MGKYSFTKLEHLRKNAEYRKVYNEGIAFHDKGLVMYVLRRESIPSAHTRLGLSVSRKIGSAVKRSKVKRLLRECYRLQKHLLTKDIDIILVARAPIVAYNFSEMQQAFISLCHKTKIMNRAPQ